MPLSPPGQKLAEILIRVLREEYRDGFRDRRQLDRVWNRWLEQVGELDNEERRRLESVTRPLEGYAQMSAPKRQNVLVQVGQELGRVAKLEKPNSGAPEVPFPPAQKAKLKLHDDVQYIKGIGPKLGKVLGKLGIRDVNDFLHHLPFRYEDRTRFRPILELRDGVVEGVRGVVGAVSRKNPRRGLSILNVAIRDQSGAMTLTFFNQKWVADQLKPGLTVSAFGKVERKFSGTQMTNPDIETETGPSVQSGRIVPVYPLTARLSQKFLRKLQYWVVPTYAPKLNDPLPEALRRKLKMPPKPDSLLEYHWPRNFHHWGVARRRLAFEELFLLQVEIGLRRQTREMEPRTVHYQNSGGSVGTPEFVELLPFQPTGAQSRVMGEIVDDLRLPTPMNRLLQGDVGAGKTVVAAFAAFYAIRNGYQAAVMAPTEILAEQHAQKLEALLAPAGLRVGRLTGSMKKREKKAVYEALAQHELDLVVGTHALIQEGVEFARLGLAVVDEQHKFGVMQRTVLRQKGVGGNPDLLVMTATPIPRTLALTLHGDLDVSRLDELPPGRQPIKSESVKFSQRKKVYEEIRKEIQDGRQAYIICPLVEESEKLEATSAVEEAEVLQKRVFPEFKVGLLHGRMKAKDKEAVMEDFRLGNTQILISTTVIEVGVDVPNATFMLVQDANRFGLAQLHQLRGRVGRGSHASRCIFMGDTKSADGQRRLKAIAQMSDGFDVAEEDLQIRGPGDFYGFRQSGFPEFRVADLLRDQELLEIARRAAGDLLARDPGLSSYPVLRSHLSERQVRSAELVH